jgi:5-methylcytosine-specific restriction endonuclease McrA
VTPARDKDGKIKRDPAKRRAFMKSNPCPVTGQTTGACPGWEVHHVVPLYQGGTDEPSNMQWLTDEEHKERHRDL